MKKILNFIIIFVMGIILVGCNNKEESEYFIFNIEIYNAREQLIYKKEFETNERELLQALLNYEEWIIETENGPDGKIITSINGLSAEENQIWNYYVNGKAATVGVELYQIQDNDKFKFILESADN